MTSRVFLVEPSKGFSLDPLVKYSPAGEVVWAAYGPVVYVLELKEKQNMSAKIVEYQSQINPLFPDEACKIILDNLAKHHFDPKYDYICMTGQLLKVAYLLAVVSANWPAVQLLLFDARNGVYVTRNWETPQWKT